MPSAQPIKHNHLIKLHWLEILACRNLHGAGRIVVPAGHIFLLVEISTRPIARVQFKSGCKRFGCATPEKLPIVARGLPNTCYQRDKANPEETREYREQKTGEGKKPIRKKNWLGGPS